MAEPIVFISRNRIKEGALDDLTAFLRQGSKMLEGEKPRTLAFLAYLDQAGTEVTIVHVFADAESMDLHVQGADERSRAAYEFMEPLGWEIYGSPSDEVLEMMRQGASSGLGLDVRPGYLGGFLRPGPA